ncbi:DUF4878 domain-containing protein [uncultured Campylobacter sp.]|uniref:DUF4878 domain-containing protein n=1 Tax=uncultured Campylobacter sp. TaxID=218934 RepID=UPI0026110002|nr:DUF4878 domain-containing protein [uncultured Campylobacter sp.]
MKQLLASCFLAFFIIACSTNNPSYVSTDYIKAIQEDDLRRAKSHIYVPASIKRELSPEQINKALEEKIKSLKNGIDDVNSCEVVKLEEIGDLATKVFIECKNKDNKIVDKTFNVINDGGVYKVILSL